MNSEKLSSRARSRSVLLCALPRNLTVLCAFAVFALVLGWAVTPARAHGDSDNCLHRQPGHPHCRDNTPPEPDATIADVFIEYVGFGGPTLKHIQIRVQVLEFVDLPDGELLGPVEADVDLTVNLDNVLFGRFTGTTSISDNGTVRFNIQNAPIGCYKTDLTMLSVDPVIPDIGLGEIISGDFGCS